MTEISAVGLNQFADPARAAERFELVEGGVMEIDDIVAKLERGGCVMPSTNSQSINFKRHRRHRARQRPLATS